MSDSKLEEKVPQMLNMLNHVNLGMTEVARTLMALERHGHTHPGDLATLSGQVTQLQAIVGQLQSFLGVQAKGIAVTQTPAVPPGRSEILAAGAQDMASSLIKYVEGVDV